MEQEYISDIAPGSGGLKYYSYSANGIRLNSKALIREAISLKVRNIVRKDKITNKLEKFNHETRRFEEVQ